MDYVPSVFCYSNNENIRKRQQSEDRYQLITKKRSEHLSKEVESENQQGNNESEDAECDESEREDSGNDIMKVEVGIQTDELPCTCKYGCDLIEGNDTATKFYTGLPSWDAYMLIFNFTAPYIPRFRKSKSKLTLQDELLMVLMRLRLSLLVADFSYWFKISN